MNDMQNISDLYYEPHNDIYVQTITLTQKSRLVEELEDPSISDQEDNQLNDTTNGDWYCTYDSNYGCDYRVDEFQSICFIMKRKPIVKSYEDTLAINRLLI